VGPSCRFIPSIHRAKTIEGISAFFLLVLFGAAEAGAALSVHVPVANIRTGPGTNYGIAWKYFKHTPLVKVGTSLSGNWYAVRDIDGDVGWVHKSLVTGACRGPIVNVEVVNVRTGPGRNYPKSPMGPAHKYYSFRVLKKKGSWIRVRDEEGRVGWIHRRYLWIP
jgi:SH3-like domain-containing protein